ncbi:hypothetical protein Tco_0591731 [Tanacetum coccineum]
MDQISSVGKPCDGKNVINISNEKSEWNNDWSTPKYRDTAISENKRVRKVFTFYKMETDEISDRYIAPCFVNGLEAYDGEINLGNEENMISNEFAVKLCLDYEERLEKKVIKKELIVALRGEIYFVKFIINPEQDDVETCVIFGRSFMHLTQGIVNFGNETITIHPELDPFLEDSDDSGKSGDEWDLWLDKINFGDIPELEGDDIPCYVCKMGKSNKNIRKQLERHESIYSDLSTSSSSGKPMTQEEATKQELALKICEKFSLLEEVRPVIETMAYSDKYKMILDEICLDKMKLDGEISGEEDKVFYKIKGEALMEKDDPGAFIIQIRLEGNINLNALAVIIKCEGCKLLSSFEIVCSY